MYTLRRPEVPLKRVLMIFRVQKGQESVFLPKIAAQGQRFGLKTILIDSIGS